MSGLGKAGIVMWLMIPLVAGTFSGCRNSADIKALEIQAVDFSGVKDGTYEGIQDGKLVMAKVQVSMKDSRMTDLKLLEHKHGPFHGADAIVPEVLKAQSLKVDAISGSTASSKVILKAVESALLKGR